MADLKERLERAKKREEEQKALKQRLGRAKEAEAKAKERPIRERVSGSVEAVARGVPVIGSFIDESGAAIGATLAPHLPQIVQDISGAPDISGETWQERYANALKHIRGKQQEFDERNPYVSPALQVAGGVASGIGAMRALPRVAGPILGYGGRTLPGQMVRSGVSGAGLSFGHGFGAGQGTLAERIKQGGEYAKTGGPLAAMSPVAARGIGRLAGRIERAAKPSLRAPTTEAHRQAANALYDAADNARVIIRQDALQRMIKKLERELAAEGIHQTLEPRAFAAMQEVRQAGNENITLRGLDLLRRVAQRAARGAKAGQEGEADRKFAYIIQDYIEDFMENLGQQDVATNTDVRQAVKLLKNARTLWSRMRKGEFIDDLVERARENSSLFTGSGYENALRNEFRKVARNANQMRRFNEAERAAIRAVSRGATGRNLARHLGRFYPSGPVAMGMGGVMGAGAVDHWAGALPVYAAGAIGRGLATLGTHGAARQASELARYGGPLPPTRAQLLAQHLMRRVQQPAIPTVAGQTQSQP